MWIASGPRNAITPRQRPNNGPGMRVIGSCAAGGGSCLGGPRPSYGCAASATAKYRWQRRATPRLARVPAKWTPVRRQGYAPTRKSGAYLDSTGTGCALVVAHRAHQRFGGVEDRRCDHRGKDGENGGHSRERRDVETVGLRLRVGRRMRSAKIPAVEIPGGNAGQESRQQSDAGASGPQPRDRVAGGIERLALRLRQQ